MSPISIFSIFAPFLLPNSLVRAGVILRLNSLDVTTPLLFKPFTPETALGFDEIGIAGFFDGKKSPIRIALLVMLSLYHNFLTTTIALRDILIDR